jgi:hypothetical protein
MSTDSTPAHPVRPGQAPTNPCSGDTLTAMPAGDLTPPPVRKAFWGYIAEGWTILEASEKAAISYTVAKAMVNERFPGGRPGASSPTNAPNVAPDFTLNAIPLSELAPIARECLDDFGRFRFRYFGRKSSPWQEDAADVCRTKLSTPLKEYGVVNCPPGSGKSTLFTHDIPAWLTCRSRSLRGFIGSSTQTIANSYTGRLRSTFARKVPMQAKSEDLALGLAIDAITTLVAEYGNFNPNIPDPTGAPWTRSQFTVAQYGEILTDEKEATWTAFGRDTGFLGWRVNFIVWDDLVTMSRLKTLEMIEADRVWYVNEAITRLEPGGLFILQGQRLGPEDLYRYSLDMPSGYALDDDLDFEDPHDFGEEQEYEDKKFFHIKYKAHYEEFCVAAEDPTTHSRRAVPFKPDGTGGCLLDPLRLSWRELKAVRAQPLSNFDVVYQQEDVDPRQVLVPKQWINGGYFDGEDYPGCYDNDRGPCQIPKDLVGKKISVVTVDPSPSKFWAIQWWLYITPPQARNKAEKLMGQRLLIDQLWVPMGGNDLLDYIVNKQQYAGVLAEWMDRSKRLGQPYRYLIVEQNAAQRFLLQYDWFRQWCQRNSVSIIPHNTDKNKADPEFGVTTIANHYRFGRVRLPGNVEGRRTSQALVDQVTHYPDSVYNDAVMAHWFFEHKLQQLVRKERRRISTYRDIPSWVKRETTYA